MADLWITLTLECAFAPEFLLRPYSSTASVRDATEFPVFRTSDFNQLRQEFIFGLPRILDTWSVIVGFWLGQ